MSTIRQKIYLAALLHDIGKFYQRADKNGLGRSEMVESDIKNLRDIYCPMVRDKHGNEFRGYIHVVYTAQFIKDWGERLERKEEKKTSDSLTALACAHHKPSSYYQAIIQKADHYSSGVDRTKEPGQKDARDEASWDAFKRKRMRSIFEGVGNNNEYTHHLPIESQALKSKDVFPRTEFENDPDYYSLWKKFEVEMKFLVQSDWKAFSNTLIHLLRKYTSGIPSSTRHLMDVSLFDHMKTTAAFAVCLYDYLTRDGVPADIKGPNLSITGQPFKLIGGDISGIQDFIYGIIPRRAAKNLKGRSFFIHLLADSVVSKIIDELDLFEANIIYASGGTFFILASNTETVDEKLEVVKGLIERAIYDEYGATIKVFLAAENFGEEELFNKKVGETWDNLMKKIQTAKQRPFQSIIEDDLKDGDMDKSFFEVKKDFDPNWEIDAIDGEYIRGKSKRLGSAEGDVEEMVVSEKTYNQIEMGRLLRDADYWVTSKEEVKYFPKIFNQPFKGSTFHYLLSKEKLEAQTEKLRGSADNIRSLAINDTNFNEILIRGAENTYGYEYYGGFKFPLDSSNKPKLFEELAGVVYKDDEKREFESKPNLVRLGILRMDVDGLGTIFKEGFEPELHTFSRLSTLSRSLDFFFKGYINVIWDGKDEEYETRNHGFNEVTQIIYSGGDDLFVVGKWDKVIELAQKINKRFREFVCGNSNITLSGGISIVGAKYPLLRAAQLAERQEKLAKSHFYGSKKKNSFSMFGHPLNWDYEFPFVGSLKDEISALQAEYDLSDGFASKVFTLLQQSKITYDQVDKKYRLQNLNAIWLVAYSFSRTAEASKSTEVKEFLNTWAEYIFTGKIEELKESIYHPLQLLTLAARWADFVNRKNYKNEYKKSPSKKG